LYKFSKANENLVTQVQNDMILEATIAGEGIIISNTNLYQKGIDKIMGMSCLKEYTQEIKTFDIDFLEALKRDARRPNGVGYDVITKQYAKYMAIRHGEDYHVLSDDKPKAFVCDLDGTVANNDGHRGFFDWDKVGDDAPRTCIIDMVKGLIDRDYTPIFVTGRDAVCMHETSCWLDDQFPELEGQYYLFMRPQNSWIKDTVLKKSIFKKYIDKKFSVEVVLDDRPSVSRMFRFELGLNVVSVANPYLEF
jgi:hypothetical protein